MKIAVLSDIHSNVFALDAVIKDLQKHAVDLKANLGDILYGPIAPKSTYELLMDHASYSIVEKTNSEWVVQNIKVPYDYQRAVKESKKKKP